MKLLIITQVIDTEHPILGFFHRWVEEFAKHCEHVHVICLQAGKHSLPANVTVHSLGKEDGHNRLQYLTRFYSLIWSLRHEYDGVFVHMNQIYVILGGLLWRVMGKRVGLWYMHGTTSFTLRIAEKITNKVFSGSQESFRLKSNKLIITGHGIDTKHFKPIELTKDLDLITVGRITPAKNLETLILLIRDLKESHPVKLLIVGKAISEEEKAYEQKLINIIQSNGLANDIEFLGAVTQQKLPQILNRAKIFVTAATNGSLDKAVLEAMACGIDVISMAEGTKSLPLGHYQVLSFEDFIIEINSLHSKPIRNNNSEYIRKEHNLENLVIKITKNYL